MLATTTIFGISLTAWYFASIVMSFCTIMAGDSYLKRSEAIPKDHKDFISASIISLIPFFNIFFAIKTLKLGLICSHNPELRDIYRENFLRIRGEFDEKFGISRKNEKEVESNDEEEV